jgi:hypothetical protein
MKEQTEHEDKVPMKEIPSANQTQSQRPTIITPLLLYGALGMMMVVLASSFFMRPFLETSTSGNDALIVEEEAVVVVVVHPILSLQRNNNKSSKDAWDVFAHHRDKVMQLVRNATRMARSATSSKHSQDAYNQRHGRPHGHGRPHAIFFGPGNCNDLNLMQLLDDDDLFDTITLVDIDNATTQQGVDRQLAASMSPASDEYDNWRKRIVISPSIDLSNAIAHTAGWTENYNKSPPRHLYTAALQAVQTPLMSTTEDWLRNDIMAPSAVLDHQNGYDVAVSLCILSQFASSFSLVLDDSRMMDLVVLLIAIRNRHFSQLIQSLRPGGHGVMMIDMVSMDTLPELRLIGDQQDDDDAVTSAAIEQLTQKAEQTGNFFHGTKRIAVMQALQGEFGAFVDNVQLGPPWKWTLAAGKQYIVYSVVFRRKQEQ